MKDVESTFSLEGKVALVTGAAGLLGKEFCESLGIAGAKVVAIDSDPVRLKNLKVKTEVILEKVNLDITKAGDVKKKISQLVEKYKRIDILVNSAAVDPKFDPEHVGEASGAFETLRFDEWEKALSVNLSGAFLMCQQVAPHMAEHGGGSIVNLGSIYGIRGPDQQIYEHLNSKKPAHYTVTKAGIHGLTIYLSAYYKGKEVRVNTLSPGGVDNNHSQEFREAYGKKTMMGRMGKRDEMSGALLFLCSKASSYVTGSNLVVDGGWSAW